MEVDIDWGSGGERSHSGASLSKVCGNLWATDTGTVQILKGEGEGIDAGQRLLARNSGAGRVCGDSDCGVVGRVASCYVSREVL